MKSMTTNLMMTAAALVIATGVASAQQYRADIPFAFRAGGKTLAPGKYTLTVKTDQNSMVFLTDTQTLHSTMLLPQTRDYGQYGTDRNSPVLTFACGSNRCSLTQMWTGSTSPALTFARPRSGKDEQASATEIRLVKMNGD
jgi:hypothetical protein